MNSRTLLAIAQFVAAVGCAAGVAVIVCVLVLMRRYGMLGSWESRRRAFHERQGREAAENRHL